MTPPDPLNSHDAPDPHDTAPIERRNQSHNALLESRMLIIEERQTASARRQERIEAKLDANNSATAEVLDILRLGKSFFRMAGWFGAFVKWATPVVTGALAIWVAWKSGK